jgi:hypothetical protein
MNASRLPYREAIWTWIDASFRDREGDEVAKN